ncbi:unnamed protein product [Prorocentrum cordatum]|uniref:Uncharacterized protein n=1 Tax=Prorocentrum cordatum TaxID=2364126 RepID=A0ABN9YGM0_9DINO|nr:unnamed protein product [Polarella glacialis]|mmetsp:Transcript_80013/g.208669  ORF Transcript_80013/g.208669 Transcript_80013/m.208669 type:complete len:516 (+) Transcript_80013:131-1678(+)
MMEIMGVFYNILGVVLLVLAGFVIWIKWDAVLLMLTGDSKIHWSRYDQAFWCCFRCCGLTSGEWTRSLSGAICKCECWPFFSRRYAGRNLVRMLGESVGLVPTQVLVENVVVGDLPCSWMRSRLYLQVEVGDGPPQVSEVLEDCNPKVAHFQTRFTLAVLRGGNGAPVRFVIRELHVLGHRDVCECHVNQGDIVDWAGAGWQSHPQGPLRFRMYPPSGGEQPGARTLPSWIFLEFTIPDEPPAASRAMGSFGLHLVLSNGDVVETDSAKKFKQDYQLLSSGGDPLPPGCEPDEEVVGDLQKAKRRQIGIVRCGFVSVLLFWLGFVGLVSYFGSCWIEWKKIAVLVEHDLDFPVAESEQLRVWHDCGYDENSFYRALRATLRYISRYMEKRFLGFVGMAPPRPESPPDASSTTMDPILNPCMPSAASVHETCTNLPEGTSSPMFPAPVLEYFVECSASFTCDDARAVMSLCKNAFDTGIILLVLLAVISCVMHVYFQHKEKRAYRLVDSGARDLEG